MQRFIDAVLESEREWFFSQPDHVRIEYNRMKRYGFTMHEALMALEVNPPTP